MKFKKIMIVSLILLAILTVGAVCATDDDMTSDNLAVSPETGDEVVSSVSNDEIMNVARDTGVLSDNGTSSGGHDVINVSGKSNSTIEIDALDSTYGETQEIRVLGWGPYSGTLHASVDGVDYYGNFTGSYSFYINGLNAGMHSVTVDYSGDEYYYGTSTSASFIVNRAPVNMTVYAAEIEEGTDLTFSVYLNGGATGDVTVYIDGRSYTVSVADGVATGSVAGLNAGEYMIEAVYLGDYNYLNASAFTTVTVRQANSSTMGNGSSIVGNKKYSSISANASDIVYGEYAIITVTGDSDYTGIVTASVGGNNLTGSFFNGVYEFSIGGLNAGSYEASITYLGDSNYYSSSTTVSFYVNMAPVNMSIVADDIVEGDELYVYVYLNNGTSGNVYISIYGTQYTSEIFQGCAKARVNGLYAGRYEIYADYYGDENYEKASASATVSVMAGNSSGNYSGGATFEDIQAMIDNAMPGETIYLYNNYTGNGNEIVINKPITINGYSGYGEAAYLHAQGASRIFNIQSEGVELISLNLRSGVNENGDGGLIYWDAYSGSVVNTTLVAGVARNGGGVHVRENGNVTFENCYFANNTALENGGDIYNGIAYNCKFEHSYAQGTGAATYNAINSNNLFEYGRAPNGAIVYGGACMDCAFVNCTVPYMDNVNNYGGNQTEKLGTRIDLNLYEREFFVGKDMLMDINLYDGNYNLVYGADLTVIVNGTSINFGNNMTFQFTPTTYGIYDIIVIFEGNEYYEPSNATETLFVYAVDPTLAIYYNDGVLNLYFPVDATGYINVTLDGVCNTYPAEYGSLHINVSYLTEGQYYVDAVYSGDSKYNSIFNSTSFTVSSNSSGGKYDAPIIAEALNIAVGQTGYINVILPQEATGMVDVTIYSAEGIQMYYDSGEVVHGTASFTIPGLDAGNYTAIARYYGDEYYLNNSTYVGFTVSANSSEKKYANMSVFAENIYAGETAYVTVYLPNDATGNVTVEVAGKMYFAPVMGHVTTVPIEGLGPGNYSAVVIYSGDSAYYSIADYTYFAVLFVYDYIVTPENFFYYFNGKGELYDFINTTYLTFRGDFNRTVPEILIDREVSLYGENATLYDMSLTIAHEHVKIANFDMYNSLNPVLINILSEGVSLSTNRIVHHVVTGEDSYVVLSRYGNFSMGYNNITYIGNNSNNINNALRMEGNGTISNIDLWHNAFMISIPSLAVGWAQTGSGDWVSSHLSEGLVFSNCENLILVDNGIFVEYNNVDGSYDTIYGLSILNSQDVNVSDSTIMVKGNSYAYAVQISNTEGVIADNLIAVESDSNYACAVDVENSYCVVEGNELFAKSTDSAYGIYVNNGFVTAINNTIIAESYFADGMELVNSSAEAVNNTVIANGNYAAGILTDSYLFAMSNSIILNASNMGNNVIWDSFGTETAGIKATNQNATIIDNFIESSNIAVSVNGHANVINNNMTGSVIVCDEYNMILNNTMNSLELAGDENRAENNLINGRVAINGSYNVLSNNNIFDEVMIGSDSNEILNNSIIADNWAINIPGGNDIIIRNNDIVSLYVAISSDGCALIESNRITGSVRSNGHNTTLINNTMDSLTVTGNFNFAEYNLINGSVEITGSESWLTNNTVYGKVTINSNSNVVEYNIIDSDDEYAVEIQYGYDNTVTENRLSSLYYMGDYAVYDSSYNTVVNNYPLTTVIVINVEDIFVGDSAVIYVNCSAGDIYTVTVDGVDYLTDHEGKVIVNGLAAGNHTVFATYPGDEDHLAANATMIFAVNRVPSTLTLSYDGYYNLRANVPDDATGFITFTLGEYGENITVEYGAAEFYLDDFVPGNYTVMAYYCGDEKYLASENYTFVTIPKEHNVLEVSAANITVGEDAIIEISSYAFPVKVIVGNKLLEVYNTTAVISGLAAGEYDIFAIFEGNEYYYGVNATSFFVVSKKESYVKPGYYADILEVYVPWDATGNVTVEIDGTLYVVETINGSASLNLSDLMPGEHDVSVTYDGDDNYSPSQINMTISVPLRATSIKVTASNINVGETAVIIVEASAGNSFVIYVDGVAYPINGSYLEIANLTTGDHVVTAKFNGDSYNLPASNTTYFTVYKLMANMTVLAENGIITVILPEDANGAVSIAYANETVVVMLVNGSAAVNASDLPAGNYTVSVSYMGDDKYYSVNAAAVLTIDQKQSETILEIIVEDIYYGDVAVIEINCPAGPVSVYVNGERMYVSNNTVTRSGLNAGEYTVDAIFNGNDNYFAANATATFNVFKANSTVMVTDVIFDYNTNGSAYVAVTNATGITAEVIDHPEAVISVENDVITISGLNAGKYTLKVTTITDVNHNVAIATAAVTVNRIVPDMGIGRDGRTITVNVPADATGSLNVVVFDYQGYMVVKYDEIAISNGTAIIDLSGLMPGEYNMNITYNGDANYVADYKSVAFMLSKAASTVTAEYADGVITVTVPGDATGNVTVSVAGISYNAIVENGVAVVNVSNLASGNYSAQVTYNGDAQYASSSNLTVFSVVSVQVNPGILTVAADDIAAGQDAVINVEFMIDDMVTVTVNNVNYTVSVVDGKGSLSVSCLAAGTYLVEVLFSGNGNYEPVMNTTQFTVYDVQQNATTEFNVTDIFVGDDEVISIYIAPAVNSTVPVYVNGKGMAVVEIVNGRGSLTLSNLAAGTYVVEINGVTDTFTVSKRQSAITAEYSNGAIIVNVPVDATGNVTLELDGIIYTLAIVDGAAGFNATSLGAGMHMAAVTYNGDENYLPAENNITFSVGSEPVSPGSLTVNAFDITADDSADIFVFFKIDTVVTVKVNNNTYNVTVSNGMGHISVYGLSVGTYLVEASFNGNDNYLPVSNTTQITVSKVETSIYAIAMNITAGETETIEVLLTNGTEGNVTITLNGKEYTAPVNLGYASLDISNLQAGYYTAIVSYSGNDIYSPASTNVSFAVSEVQQNVTYDFTVNNITYGDNVAVSITASQGVNETVEVTVTTVPQSANATSVSTPYIVEMVNGKATFNIPNLNAGNYRISVKGIQKKFTVAPKGVTLTVNSIVYGEETITLNLDEELQGEILISVNGVNYTAVIENRTATFNASGLDADNYTLDAVYVGNNNFYLNERIYQLTVEKLNATFNLTVDSITYSENETIEIDVGPGITGEIFIDIGDKSYVSYANNGKVIFDVKNLDAGNHRVTLRYAGNNNTYSNTVIYNITVKQAQVNMTTHIGNLTYSKNNTIAIEVPEGVTGNITIIIGNRHYTQIIDNRIVIFHIQNIDAGNYEVTAIYEGNNNYYNKTTVFNIVIEQMDVTFTADVREVSYNEQSAMRINVPEGVTGNVTVIIGNYTYDTIILDGVIEYYITNINAGNHAVRVIYHGNNNYYHNETTFNITIKKLDVDITLDQDTITYSKENTFTLNIPEGVDGDIFVRIGNETYNTVIYNGTATINAVNIKAGNYLLEAVYSGNDNYNNVTRFFNITIERMHVGIELGVGSVSYNRNQTLNLIFPEEATGNVSIRIGDKTVKTTVINGNATFNVIGIDAGNYVAQVVYEGNDYYNEETTYVNITIDRIDVGVSLKTPTINYNEQKSLTINLSDIAEGNVSVEIGDKKFYSTVNEKGEATFTVTGVKAGKYSMKVRYDGDRNHYGFEEIFDLTIAKLNTFFNVTSNDIACGESEVISVSLLGDVTGDVNVVIDGVTYTVPVKNGVATVNITNLLPGTYTATVNYLGDENHNANAANTTFTVAKAASTVSVRANDINSGENATVNVILPNDATGTVTVIVGGKSYTVAVKDGKASVTVAGLAAGSYDAVVSYAGDAKYLASNSSASFKVSKVASTVSVSANDINAGENAVVSVTLPEDATGTVTVIVNGKSYNVTVKDGKASVTVADLSAGNYTVSAIYAGDAKYLASEAETEFKVNSASTTFSVTVDDVEFGETLVISVSLPRDATGRMTLAVDGMTLTATIRNGKATFTTSGLLPGHYEAAVTYNGNAKYAKETQTIEFDVFKIVPTVEISADDIKCGENENIVVTLPDDATGEVNVYIAGKKYTTECADGVAILFIPNLAAGQYDAVAVYGGDEIYEGANATASFNVSKIDPFLDVSADDVDVDAPAVIEFVLPDDATGEVTVSYNGQTQRIADFLGGYASVNATFDKPGVVNVTVTYSGDDKYNAASGSASFEVNPIEAPITIIADDVNADESTLIRVILPDDATGGLHISAGGSVSYMSDFKGGEYSTEKVYGTAGNVTVQVTYDGNDKYLPSQASQTFTVKAIPAAMIITADAVYAGETATITVTLPEDAVGSVAVSYPGGYRGSNINNGKFSFTTSFAEPGNYTISAEFSSAGKYLSVSNSTVLVVTVKPVDPEMEVVTLNVKEGNDAYVDVLLPEDATGEVTLELNGVKYTEKVDEGVASFTLSDLDVGQYNGTVTYSGDAKYAKSEGSAEFTVKKDTIATVIVMESKFSRYATDYSAGERGAEFTATLYDVDKNPLAGKDIQITVNGVIYNQTSDENGNVGLAVNLAAANTYTYALLFYGDEEYKASPIASSKLTVVKKPTEIIANNMAFKTNAKIKTVSVALSTIKNPYDGKMYLKKGKTLTLKVNGDTYTAKTDGDGIANFNIKLDKKGTYTATVSFEGDATYEAATKNIKIVISKSASKNKELKVGSGMTPANIDAGGEMNIEGNFSEYLENVTTSEVSADKKDAFIHVDSKFTRVANDYGAGERGDYFYAYLKDAEGNAIVGKTIQISVNGPIYDVVTDSEGKAGLQVNLAAANIYTYALTFSGDDEYNPALIASSKLTVVKKTTSISAKAVSFKVKAKKSVSVTLKTSKNPYDGKTYLKAGKVITLSVGGKTYSAKTNSKGVAKFSIQLKKKGKYTAKVKFAGDATYESCNKNVKITIK